MGKSREIPEVAVEAEAEVAAGVEVRALGKGDVTVIVPVSMAEDDPIQDHGAGLCLVDAVLRPAGTLILAHEVLRDRSHDHGHDHDRGLILRDLHLLPGHSLHATLTLHLKALLRPLRPSSR